MGKQSKPKTTQSFGKGKVTPMQVAFIVDRYLSDKNFSDTRSTFRTEAVSLISKSPIQEAPRSLLSLEAMLDEYICLKEQRVMVDQEKSRLEQEKIRVQTLLQGMQDVMNAYNVSGNSPSPPLIQNSAANATRSMAAAKSPAGAPLYMTKSVMPVTMPSNVINHHTNMSSTVTNLTRKRVGSIGYEPPSTNKKSCKLPIRKAPNQAIAHGISHPTTSAPMTETAAESSMIRSSSLNHLPSGSVSQGSSVAKSLFNQPLMPSTSPNTPTTSTGPNTPPRTVSPHNGQSVSPTGVSSLAYCRNNITSQETTPTNCTVITSERVTVSPCKHVSYTMERNRCISSSSPVKTTFKRLTKRENVKGRLDFDGSDVAVSVDTPIAEELSTSESDKEADIFDMDLPNLDALGPNFNFSELLIDLDLGYEGIDCPCPSILGASTDNISGSSPESGEGYQWVDPLTSEISSTMTEVVSGTDMSIQGPDTVTAVKSITQCIIVSPAKSNRSPSMR